MALRGPAPGDGEPASRRTTTGFCRAGKSLAPSTRRQIRGPRRGVATGLRAAVKSRNLHDFCLTVACNTKTRFNTDKHDAHGLAETGHVSDGYPQHRGHRKPEIPA